MYLLCIFNNLRQTLIIFQNICTGTMDDKTRIMFDMYDIDNSGFLDREEFSMMLRYACAVVQQLLPGPSTRFKQCFLTTFLKP